MTSTAPPANDCAQRPWRGIESANRNPPAATAALASVSDPHIRAIVRVDVPVWRRASVPAVPCGTFETNTATTNATLTPPPRAMPTPRMNASGSPSKRAPRNIADARATLGIVAIEIDAVVAAPAVDDPIADVVHERADQEPDADAPPLAGVAGRDQLVGDGAQHRAGAEPHQQPGGLGVRLEDRRQRLAEEQGGRRQPAPEDRVPDVHCAAAGAGAPSAEGGSSICGRSVTNSQAGRRAMHSTGSTSASPTIVTAMNRLSQPLRLTASSMPSTAGGDGQRLRHPGRDALREETDGDADEDRREDPPAAEPACRGDQQRQALDDDDHGEAAGVVLLGDELTHLVEALEQRDRATDGAEHPERQPADRQHHDGMAQATEQVVEEWERGDERRGR